MGNLITKYQKFLFEATSINTEVATSRQKLEVVKDKLSDIKIKYDKDLVSAGSDETKKLQAEANYIDGQIKSYQEMIPLMTELKNNILKKVAAIKS